jgi:hypothetical protein
MAFYTQRDVDRLTLPPGKTEHFEFDGRCQGNSVRLQGGSKAYVTWFTVRGIRGKRKRLTLGPVAGMSLDEARRKTTDIINATREGRDPAAERKQARAAAANRLLVRDLARDYLDAIKTCNRRYTRLPGRPASRG